MIDRISGKFGSQQVICDCCGDGFEYDSFVEAREIMAREGWKNVKIDHHYEHYCPDCYELMSDDLF